MDGETQAASSRLHRMGTYDEQLCGSAVDAGGGFWLVLLPAFMLIREAKEKRKNPELKNVLGSGWVAKS